MKETAMAEKRKVSNLLGLAVLSYLSQEPMHPYALGRALREHGDARSIKYSPGSLYMVVGQLARAGLVEEHATGREGQRPEHTVYALTDAGRRELHDWLRELVGQPRHEYPDLVAALAFVSALPPGEVSELLTGRLDLLAQQRAEISGLVTDSVARGIPGLFLLEEEYRLALLDAESGFVQRLIVRMADPATDWITLWADHHNQTDKERGTQ
jgi:DNA-binding PadR family transcriptional regulator